MIINHNMSALFANRQLNFTTRDIDRSIEKLSSGMRINKAGDDASGLAVSEKMRSQIRGLNQANRNAQNGISFIQTSEGYLNQMTEALQRMRELAIQSANGIYSDSDRRLIQVEMSQLVDEVDRIASHAEFNQLPILQGRFANPNGENVDASLTTPMRFHIGANADQNIQVYIKTMTSQALGLGMRDGATDDRISIADVDRANMSLGRIDVAIQSVIGQRADLGAMQNRMEYMVRGLAIAAENITAAESVIRDTDMAEQMVEYVRDQILIQSGSAMLASANTKSQAVMRILG